MSKDKNDARPEGRQEARPEARLAKGFRDIEAAELSGLNEMLGVIRGVYERYGFEALETPAIEYTDALGKFLPDQDRPNAGVFSFQDEDSSSEGGQWMSLRYDLTAPLARYVAQNFDKLPKPFRRYAFGNVYRNEKPGPGRFKQFMQFDADTVGSDNIAADAEMCMLAADTLEALGLKGKYVIKVNSRKVLDGVRIAIGLGTAEHDAKWLTAMRALDKFDRLGSKAVDELLGPGRRDESGDFTHGAGLTPMQISWLRATTLVGLRMETKDVSGSQFDFTFPQGAGGADEYLSNLETLEKLERLVTNMHERSGIPPSPVASSAVAELKAMSELFKEAGYDQARIRIDLSVIRGLEYYTGPVFEAELTFEVKGDDGKPVRFGSVGGGGRYDDLVSRFTGQKVPATGFSIGVSRLQAALAHVGAKAEAPLGPVVVLVMAEKGEKPDYAQFQKLVQRLRKPDDGSEPIRAEMYLGSGGMNAQMKYANKRNAACVVIQGGNERDTGKITLKDLIEGAKAAPAIKDNKEWKEARAGQITVDDAAFVTEVRKIIARHTA